MTAGETAALLLTTAAARRAPLLKRLADEGKTFASLAKGA